MKELPGDDFEKLRRGSNLAFRMTGENPADDGLDGARRRQVEPAAARRELEAAAPTVRRIHRASDEPAALEPLEDSGDGTGVEPQDSREGARGHSGSAPEHSQGHPLRAGQPQGRLHPLRKRLEPMIERPDEPHEIEDLAERGASAGLRGRLHAGDLRTPLI